MIKLSELVVMVVNHDGTTSEFDSEQFQAELIRSFLAVGNDELWVTEDIVMAVEYALLAHDSDNKIFTLTEIETIITVILEDAGFADVAASYRSTHLQPNITCSPQRGYLLQLLSRHARLSGRILEAVTDKVITASQKIDIAVAAPELFVELAKYYKSQLLNADTPGLGKLILPASSEHLSRIRTDQIKAQLSDLSVRYLDKHIIQLYNISSLFPAVRIAINITQIAENEEWTPPVTELLLLPHFNEIATVINDVVTVTETIFQNKTATPERNLPLYISVLDMAEFAECWLEATWPECRPCCRDIMSFLEDMLDRKPFKLTM